MITRPPFSFSPRGPFYRDHLMPDEGPGPCSRSWADCLPWPSYPWMKWTKPQRKAFPQAFGVCLAMSGHPQTGDTMTTREACEFVGVSRASFFRWVAKYPEVASLYERARKNRHEAIRRARWSKGALCFFPHRRAEAREPLPSGKLIRPRRVYHPEAHFQEWDGVSVTDHHSRLIQAEKVRLALGLRSVMVILKE